VNIHAINAFIWQAHSHMDTNVITCDSANCTTAYNQWRCLMRDKPHTTPDWPAWRDAKLAAPSTGHRKPHRPGMQANHGTMHGLTPRADKLLAIRPAHVAFVIPRPSAASRAARA